MDAHPRCGIAGSRIYNYDGTVQQSVGEFDTWAGAFLRSSAWGEWPLLRSYANGAGLRGFGYDAPRRVDLAIGAALAIRRALIAEIGPFDERFFLYHEEVDYAKRAHDAGWETWFVPASEAVHEGMGSARGQYSVEARKQTLAPQVLAQAPRPAVVLRAGAARWSGATRSTPARSPARSRSAAGCARALTCRWRPRRSRRSSGSTASASCARSATSTATPTGRATCCARPSAASAR